MSMWYGTVMAPEQAPPAKRNHNRSATSGKPKEPLTTEQQAQATTLAAAGYSPNKISKTIGKSRHVVTRHLDKPEVIAAMRDERAELVEIYRNAARACVVAIDDEKIAKSSALQLATASGICLDKSLLLSGQPTSINVVALMDVADLIRQQDNAESKRQHQQAQALLSLPANQT
jgi:hypothetical protein